MEDKLQQVAEVDSSVMPIDLSTQNTLYFIPIQPESQNTPRNIGSTFSTKPPPFMDTVKEMRERFLGHMHKAQMDSNRKTCVKRWKDENKRIYGVKVTLKNYEKIAQLSERCFLLVVEIEKKFLEGELSCTTKAKTISQAFFQFLNGKSEPESYDLLSEILQGKKTATELNYVPSGKKSKTANESEIETDGDVQLRKELEKVNDEFQKERWVHDVLKEKYKESISRQKELEKVVEGLQSTIANQEATIDLQRKRLRKVTENHRDWGEIYRETIQIREEAQDKAEKKIDNLRLKLSSMEEKLEEKTSELLLMQEPGEKDISIDEDNEEYSPKKKELFEEHRRNKRKDETASRFLNHDETLIEEQKTDALAFVTIFGEGMSKCQESVLGTAVLCESPNEKPVKENCDKNNKDTNKKLKKASIPSKTERTVAKSSPSIETNEKTEKRMKLDTNKDETTVNKHKALDWVAVAYEATFYIGQVVREVDDCNVVIKFLERKGGDYYQWPKRDDIATVETKFIFTKAIISPEGKHFELKEPLENMQKLFKAYKKKYFQPSCKDQNEVVCTATIKPKSSFYFWPVDGDWQGKKQLKFGLELIKKHPTKKRKALKRRTAPAKTVPIQADGNCFFRSISYWLTGDEEQHEKVRTMLVSYMGEDEWKERGRNIVGRDIDEYLTKVRMNDSGVWATETEIHAMANLLLTTIFVYYTYDEKNYEWLPHYPLCDKQEKCIYLKNTGVHFEPVIAI